MDMTNEEREILRKILDYPSGLLSQSDFLNLLPNRNTRIMHSLITSGYIEEVTRRIKFQQFEATFYRITEKGRMVFAPFYRRYWFAIKGDVRTVIVSVITALLTTAITILITSQNGK